MYKRYYDGYGSAPVCEAKGEVIVPKESPSADADKISTSACAALSDAVPTVAQAKCATAEITQNGFLKSLALDDIILIGVIILFLADGTDDRIMIVILAAIFLLGLSEK